MNQEAFNFIKKVTITSINQIRKIERKIINLLSRKKYADETIYAVIVDINRIVNNIDAKYITETINQDPANIMDIYEMILNCELCLIYLYEDLKSYKYDKKLTFEEYKEIEDNNFIK